MSVRRSAPGATPTGSAEPTSVTSSSGHGRGLRWQKRRKSYAEAFGSTARLAWTWFAPSPAVMPVSLPFRMSRRISRGWRASIGMEPFYLWPRRGHTSGFTSTSGFSPRSTRSISPATCTALCRFASRVTPATCGEQTTFSRFRRGLSRGVGSSSHTSRPAAPRCPRVRASKSARSSCTGPREVLTKMAPGFMSASVFALIMCVVSDVSGVWHVRTSTCGRRASRLFTGSAPRRRTSSSGTYLSYARTRIPIAPANFATRRPMLPTPTMPSVLPASSLLPTMRLAPQSPRRVVLSISRVRLTQASMSISACSATAWEFEPGAWTTATPSRVAAGTSTVSRPTPCRPTTLSFGQRAIRLSVQLGRRRNRIPAASAATLTSPASVSSSQTTTRASLSRSDLPSGLIGPASTTRGRDWVAIERVSFLWRSGLFAGDENQARGVQREGRALEPAVELHPAPALRPQHRRELVGGVEADLALPDQLPRALLRLRRCALEAPPPRAPAARRGIELVLDAERPAADPLALLGRQRPHQLISIPGIEDEDAAWPERAPESIGHQAVLVVREIADRAEEVDREVELARELHVTDVLADEPERDAGLGGGLPRAVELGLAEVDAGHLVAASRELDRVTAESARRVEDACARVERRDADDPLDVARRVRRRLERLRDLGPRLAKEPLAVEHGGHCSGLRAAGPLGGWPETRRDPAPLRM